MGYSSRIVILKEAGGFIEFMEPGSPTSLKGMLLLQTQVFMKNLKQFYKKKY